MQRWIITILFLALGLKLVGGTVVEPSHHMGMEPMCEGGICRVAPDECLKHCLAAVPLVQTTPAELPTVFSAALGAAILGVAVLVVRKVRARVTILAPPALQFVRTTILRE